VDGSRGDHVLLAPPFIITPEECRLIAGHCNTRWQSLSGLSGSR